MWNRPLRKPFEEGGDGVGAELGSVESGGRQAAKGGRDFLRSDGMELRGGFPEQEIGEDGAGSNGGDATLGFEASGGDAASFDTDG